mgnify:FL=1
MSSPLAPTGGREALETAQNLVIKIGGENAVRLGENFRNARERIERGQSVSLVVSALRGGRWGGFNTTSQLIAIAQALRGNDADRALSLAGEMEAWTRDAVRGEIEGDASLTERQSRQLGAMLQDVIREKVQMLRLHILSHAHGRLHALGEDWVLRNGEYFSITGWGEYLAQRLYRRYCEFRGIANAGVRAGPAEVIRRLTYAQAYRLVAPGGAAAGVIHPRALRMCAEKDIPVVVCGPADECTDRTTLIS